MTKQDAKGIILKNLCDNIGPVRAIQTLEDPINFELFESLTKILSINAGDYDTATP